MKKRTVIIALIVFVIIFMGGITIRANYIIQLEQRNAANTEWDNLYPVTTTDNVITKYNVKTFGAKGDWNGTTGTDDTVAIQAAIDAAYSAGNGTVVFPDGEKFLAKNIVVKSSITIEGNGSTIVNNSREPEFLNPTLTLTGNLTSIATTLSANLLGGAYASTVPITANVTSASGFSVGDDIEISDNNGKEFNVVKSVSGNTITLKRRPVRTYTTTASAKITKVTVVKDVTISNLKLVHVEPVENSIVIKYTINSSFNDLIIKDAGNGIFTDNSEGVTVSRCRIQTSGISGSSRCATIGQYARHCKVTECTLTYGRPGVLVAGEFSTISNNNIIASGAGLDGDGITVWGSDNAISNNTISSGDCYGIWVLKTANYDPQRNIISNNVIEATITTGVYLNGGADHIVTGNTFRQNSVGVAVNESTGCTITNNTIVDCSNIGIALFSTRTIVTGNRLKSNINYGLYMYSDADYCIIKDNIMDGTGGLIANSKTHNVIKDNIINGVIN